MMLRRIPIVIVYLIGNVIDGVNWHCLGENQLSTVSVNIIDWKSSRADLWPLEL